MGEDRYYGIEEIPSESYITIDVKTLDKRKGKFTSKVIEDGREGEGFLDVEPILHNDKVIGFNVDGLIISLETIQNGLHLEYHVSKIDVVKLQDGTIVHRVYSHEKAKYKNLRGCKRFALGKTAVVQLGYNRKAVDCYIRDISSSGIGMEIKGKVVLPPEAILSVVFTVHNKVNVGARSKVIRIEGKAVRTVYNEEEDNTFMGVQLRRESQDLNSFIADIQKEELAKLNHERLKNIQ